MNSAASEEKYLLLDHTTGWDVGGDKGIGWPIGKSEGLYLDPQGHFTLNPIPGPAERFLGPEEHEAAIVSPAALAITRQNSCDDDDKLLLIDSSTHQVTRIDLKKSSNGMRIVETLQSIGGAGSDPRKLWQPHGIAALPSGEIAIADTGNHRVQLFSPVTFALLQLWGNTDSSNRPVIGTGARQFSSPWDLASDDRGNVYVVDRGNHRIQKISSDGTWLADIGAQELVDPTRVAIGPNGLIAVIDSGKPPALLIFGADGKPLSMWSHFHDPERGMEIPLEEPRSLAFESRGGLYVGNGKGLIYALLPDQSQAQSNESEIPDYVYSGLGDTNIVGEIFDLAWHAEHGLIAIIAQTSNDETTVTRRLWRVDPRGAFASKGTLTTRRLDSRIDHCQWHRISVAAVLPKQSDTSRGDRLGDAKSDLGGSSLQIESFVSDELLPNEEGKRDAAVIPDNSAGWVSCILTADSNPDCLVQSGPGRYLWLRLTFRSNGLASPSLSSMKVFYPRASYLQYLPAVYQEDEESRLFLDRFLSIFQTGFDAFDARIDRLWQLFEPLAIPQEHLGWLAAWLALHINPEWQDDKKRRMLKNAFVSYRRGGTLDGLEQAVVDYADVSFAQVLEHFRIRRWPLLSVSAPLNGSARLWSRDFYQRLQLSTYSQSGEFQLTGFSEPALEPLDWGAHQFTVFFPADPYCPGETTDRVMRLVEREKPVHTSAVICAVLPRFRIGVQATIGVDSVVGGISNLVLNSNSTLNYDSILSCSVEERQVRKVGSSKQPRAGVTTVLA